MAAARGRRKLVVVAFGGNVLVQRDEDGTQREQIAHAESLARSLVRILRRNDLLIVHGNGPQVGNLLVQVEEAITKVPPMSLDICVAQTEGSIGCLLERALRNRMTRAGIDRQVICMLTHIVVDPHDPGMSHATKPVGPFYTPYRAAYLRKNRRWEMVEDSGRGYRKVVPSPRPKEVIGMEVIRALLEARHVVIAGGGGGVPATRDATGRLKGIEAVIDKDFTASLLARELGADLLLILTDVDQVSLNYGKKTQKPLPALSVGQAARLLRQGQFPPGSMGPKVEAAIEFSRSTGHEVVITSLRRCVPALAGRGGTRISVRGRR